MNIITYSQFKALQLQGLVICPCCRRTLFEQYVANTSIFDIEVKICQRCSITEKQLPQFNWIKETRYDKNTFLAEELEVWEK